MKLRKFRNGYYGCKYTVRTVEYSIIIERTAKGWVSTISLGEKSHQIGGQKTKKTALELAVEFCDNPSCHLLIDIDKDFKNLNYEDVEAFFVSPEYKKIVSPYQIKRIQNGSDRYYCTYTDAEPKFYLSVTSFSSKVLPNPYLAKWRGDLGNDLADFKADLAAEYGTFLHIEIGDFIKSGKYCFDDVDERVIDYLLSKDLSMKLILEWVNKIHNDMLSFLAFWVKHEVEAVFCEFPIVSNVWELGGCLDLGCTLTFNRQRVNALVDFKSGRKGFYESHELQLKAYREMFNETFGDIFPITHIFNWAPTEWRCEVGKKVVCPEPKFKLKNQDNGNIIIEKYLELGLAHGFTKKPKPVKRGVGTFEINQKDLSKNISIINLSDYVKAKS